MMEAKLMITCGIDWAEDHHDVALVDESGKLLAKRRIGDDVNGYRQLVQLLADFGDRAEEPVPVAVETARGLLIACLRTTGRKVYSINPMAVARYRERRTVARAKSDHADAMTLANILRTDAAAHRPLPADTELVQAIAVLARAQQDAVWNRARLLIAASCVRGTPGLDNSSHPGNGPLSTNPYPPAGAGAGRPQLPVHKFWGHATATGVSCWRVPSGLSAK